MQSITAPPEVSSALVNTGPGATSLLEAAAAWRLLGTQLDEQADGYVSAVSTLVDSWRGRSAAAMVQSAEPYLLWLRATAQHCRRTATSIQHAAAAFDSVRAAVTPTAAIAANRARRTQLLATNRFGTNSAAIAENESQYLAMWTTNTAAMVRYRAASAQATTLSGFNAPTATPSAETTSPDSILASLQALVNPYDPNYGWSGLANTYANQFVSSGFPINLLSYLAQNTSAQALQNVNAAIGEGLTEGEAAIAPALPLGGLGALGAAGLTEMPSAALGVGMKVGPLTVPPAAAGSLATAQAPVQLASAAAPLPAPESAAFSGVPAIMPPVVPPSAATGSGWRKRRQQKYEDLEVGLELRGPVMPKPPSAG